MRKYRLGAHTKTDLKVHVVWLPKYRKPVLTGDVAIRVRDIIRQIAAEQEIEIISGKVAQHTSELLPVGYFHLVFTLPHELNRLILANKKTVLGLLFKAVSQTLLEFGHRRLEGTLSIIAVLHTWDQTLKDHFHLHCLVPAGAPSFDQNHDLVSLGLGRDAVDTG